MERIQPFLKWAGGKFKLVDAITRQFPNSYHPRYIEPFVGAGAVAINVVDFQTVVINDVNADLINVWTMLRTQPEEVIRQVGFLFSGLYNNAGDYYQLRKEFNARLSTDARQTALFIYLNKHGFNGLCRYNRKGEFNVPFGKYATVNFDPEKLRNISKKMQGWIVANQDYKTIMDMAGEGDIMYLDPPYVPLSRTASFTSYSPEGFGMKDQQELSYYAEASVSRGATVIISNHDTSEVRELYKNATEIHKISVRRNISCRGETREKVGELIAVYRP